MKPVVFVISFLLLGLTSCVKSKHYSNVPALTYVGYTTGDTTDQILHQQNKYVKLTFSFTDGDGDLGLAQGETQAPYDYNVFATLYLKNNGQFEEKAQEKSRITDLSKYATRNGLEGTIDVTYIPYMPSGSVIRYDLYVLDKALHKSNAISTPEIVLP